MPFRRKPCPECDLLWEFLVVVAVFLVLLWVLDWFN